MSSVKLHPFARTPLVDADALGVGVLAKANATHTSSDPSVPLLPSSDPAVREVVRLLKAFGGVILSGAPGTSKSYLAAAVAEHLTPGHRERREYVQFHASYGYEDFVEGYRPRKDGSGFELVPGVLLRMVRQAEDAAPDPVVLVIDELSRADVGRVFGEALTYIEKSKRHLGFTLASGDRVVIPENLWLVATMNPLDRNVDGVDTAFERRFAKMAMDPDASRLQAILDAEGLEEPLYTRVLAWFRSVNGRAKSLPAAAVGHTYFVGASDEAALRDIWDYQLKYLVERGFRFAPDLLKDVVSGWERIFGDGVDAATGDAADEA